MDTKKLIAALALVAIVGIGAHLYLSKMDHKHGKKWQDYKKEQMEQSAEADSEVVEETTDAAEEPAPSNPAPAAPQAQAPVTETPTVSDPTPAPEEAGVDDILAGFDDDDAEYNDAGLDEEFSGNLDEGI